MGCRLFLPGASNLLALALFWSFACVAHAESSGIAEYRSRVEAVRSVPGLAAFWDFVLRENAQSGQGRFLARRGLRESPAFPLEAVNYVRSYWEEGREASYADFPLLGRGPFGQAVHFRDEAEPDFRPTLLLPREALHRSPLDVGGPGESVSMVVWMIREGGNHAIAGIWHEGTDLKDRGKTAAKVQTGRRQYALFAGLAANDGASAVHVSENGVSSFGDRYARNLATTRRLIPTVPVGASPEQLDAAWSSVGFVFDNGRNTVTAYLDGTAEDNWIEAPAKHPFFRWPAEGWRQASLRQIPGLQEGENPDFSEDQFYRPPEDRPRKRKRVSQSDREQIWDLTYEFTRVRETRRWVLARPEDSSKRGMAKGHWELVSRELLALRVNPFWFGHDLYRPKTPDEGGPFTIGRVIHSSRSVGARQYIGGVAVYNRALSPGEMRKLANIGTEARDGHRHVRLLHARDLSAVSDQQ